MSYFENNIRLAANNLKVCYIDEGKNSAPLIIFLHGFPFNKSMWYNQVDALKDNFRVIAYDIRGHGNSDSGNGDFSIELFVKDLLSLMDTLEIDKAVLCGLSMGGYIALNAIENFRDRFTALILSDTQCIADTAEAKEKRKKAIENIRKNGIKLYAEESVKNLFAPGSFTTRVKEIAAVREMIVNTSEQSLVDTLHALSMRKETCSKLVKIKVPVLILVGSEDKITPPEAAQFMHEKTVGSILRIIEHAGHMSNLENPDEFNVQMKEFVRSVFSEEES